MQTLYYTTENFIRRTDNVVDLAKYRRKLAQASEAEAEERSAPVISLLPEQAPNSRTRRRERLRRRALTMDLCASMGILVMTLTFTLRVLSL